jgi:hypothetical protein
VSDRRGALCRGLAQRQFGIRFTGLLICQDSVRDQGNVNLAERLVCCGIIPEVMAGFRSASAGAERGCNG